MNKLLLQGKTAIITGASYGMGLDIARLFSQEGANVVLTARGQDKLDEAVASITDQGGHAIGVAGDVASTEDCKRTFQEAVKAFGTVDILVNNAGLGTQYMCEYAPDEELDLVTGVNFRGPFIFCREALNIMLPKKSGVIINVSSVNGVRPMCGAVYTATKGALNTLTRNIAIRCVGTGVRCNALCPGFTVTPMSTNQEKGGMAPDDQSMVPILHSRTVRNQPCTPENQADTALFLASDLSAAVQGQILVVDNGCYL